MINARKLAIFAFNATVIAALAGTAASCRQRGEASAPASSSTTTSPPIRSVASVKQLMAGMIDPAADVVWGAVGTTVTKEGTEDRRPRTDQEWDAVRNAALGLTEGGNLLMLGDRVKDRGAWLAMSRALTDAGAVAFKAAEEKNVQALFDSGEAITTACDTCHAAYWKEETASAPASTSSRLLMDDEEAPPLTPRRLLSIHD